MYGLNAARQPDGEAEADLLLGEYRKMDPGPLEEMIFFDHPERADADLCRDALEGREFVFVRCQIGVYRSARGAGGRRPVNSLRLPCDLVRNFVFLFCGAALLALPSTRHDALDPAFERAPFQQWLGEGPGAEFHWRMRVSRAELSFHQRLVATVEIALDGKDLETRRDGRLVFLIQITGGDGARYQDHSSVELNKLDENIKTADLGISQRAFFLPGDYQLAAAVFDSATGEHSAIQTQFRVAAPAAGFLGCLAGFTGG